jgi:hypothetical protein
MISWESRDEGTKTFFSEEDVIQRDPLRLLLVRLRIRLHAGLVAIQSFWRRNP